MDDARSSTLSVHAARIAELRRWLAAHDLDGFLVPRGDEHLGEYVPPSAERLAWLSGFTGSAGLACVLGDRALVWSDGRYVLQLAQQTDDAVWERLHIVETPPAPYLAKHAGSRRIGYDPWLMSAAQRNEFAAAGVVLVPTAENPIDAIWTDRPAAPLAPARPHPLAYAGRASEEKRAEIAAQLREQSQDAAIITDPASIAWLLNIRGADLDDTPLALGFAILHADGGVQLYMAPEKVPADTRAWLGNAVSVAPRAALPEGLAGLRGRTVRVDEAGSGVWFSDTLREAGARVIAGADPCLAPKARKNPTEQAGARAAQARDAVAMARFLHWLDRGAAGETEISIAAKLAGFRAEQPHARGPSFPTIAGSGPHGAIMHYRATPASNRTIGPREMLLVDSGGQYLDGTTDITRTVWTGPDAPPAELRDRYTRVLRGHIALATLQFPEGVPGVRLDAVARLALWQAGLDYDHGTGHGIGSFLSVHEGPASISPYLRAAPIEAGMILSNEPGFYLPGEYGIRLENLVLVHEADTRGPKRFLRFETITLAPFARTLIEPGMLSPAERDWLDAYHARVASEIAPHCPPETAAWLHEACAPL